MNTIPITPVALTFNDQGIPFSSEYQDIYHPRAGADVQARHVFLGGNLLPQRWQGRDRFVILETGFGLGNNFLATWQAWRDDPQRCAQLFFISIERHPLSRADLEAVHRDSPARDLAVELHREWPPLTPGMHRLGFESGSVVLLLALGDVQAWLPELVASVDAFYLDGFSPATNPRMWDERVCKALGRLAAPGATLATWSAAHALREGLATAGFDVRLGHGTGGKRDITLATFAPAFTPRHAPARSRNRGTVRAQALIVGGGLAGCAAAWALAEQGWSSTILERHSKIASQASGNAAGLFHGIVNAQDGVHARFNRAAALAAREAVHVALETHGVQGSAEGLLRLETSQQITQMEAMLNRLALPPEYVRAVSAGRASALSGIGLREPAWFYPGGGWVQPAGLARSFVERGGSRIDVRFNVDVHALQRTGSTWHLLDARGQAIAESPTVVLANAIDALRLLREHWHEHDWPIDAVRGQISVLPEPGSKLALPRMPIAGAGYLLPEIDGHAIFGATSQTGDLDPAIRQADHAYNLAQLARLVGSSQGSPPGIDPGDLTGRTAWRCSSKDRLPLIGAVPDIAPASTTGTMRLDQPRFVPRLPGLFVFMALGSRGITWSALGAQVLASIVTGGPVPLEASLLDALDPARFVSRRFRRTAA